VDPDEQGRPADLLRVGELAGRSGLTVRKMVEQLTGGDPSMARSVRSVYCHEAAVARKTGLDPEVFEFIARANAVARED
jgi:hypothetical protein